MVLLSCFFAKAQGFLTSFFRPFTNQRSAFA